jgi:hypothetical protein
VLQDSSLLHCCRQRLLLLWLLLLLLLLLLWLLLLLLTCQLTDRINHALHQLLHPVSIQAAAITCMADRLLHLTPAAQLMPVRRQCAASGLIHPQHMLQRQITRPAWRAAIAQQHQTLLLLQLLCSESFLTPLPLLLLQFGYS